MIVRRIFKNRSQVELAAQEITQRADHHSLTPSMKEPDIFARNMP